jgi:RimJ/RimL family protein N-acetyltransferase
MTSLAKIVGSSAIEFEKDNKVVSLSLVDNSEETASLITKWRSENIKWYDSNFSPTKSRTEKWLRRNILNSPDNILFLILVNENKIGHIGLTDYDMGNDSVKIMSVVKGENVFFPRLMEYVGKNLINWIFYELNISTVKVRVFSDNYKAINMNERIGMLTVDSIPMKKEKTLDGFSWKECRFNCKDDSRIVRYMNIMEIHR